MPVVVPALGLAYFPVPKNACTSLKHFFYGVNESVPFTPEAQENGQVAYIHDIPGYLSPLFEPRFVSMTRDRARLAVIRHPFRRLISAYNNRVHRHWELSAAVLGQEVLERTGLLPDPPFDLFMERIGDYTAVSPSMWHHTAPQTAFLGPDLSIFHHVHRVEELPRLQELLGRLAGRPVVLPHDQQGGQDLPDPPLTPGTRRRMREFCAPDLERLAAWYGAE